MHKRIVPKYACTATIQYFRYSKAIQSTQNFVVVFLFMASKTHFQRSWMAQEKYRKAAVGDLRDHWPVHGEEPAGFLHCPCPIQHSVVTSV